MSRVLLVGMMGSGKTTVGRVLAERLGWAFLDSDEQVLRRTGRTVPEIFAARGEADFRVEETAALEEAATSLGPTVVAVAGGAVLAPENRRRLRQAGTVVWLRGRVATLAQRLEGEVGRPLLDRGGDPAVALERLDRERRPLYQELADATVDVDDKTVTEVVEAIVAAMGAEVTGGQTG